jgi:N-acetylneuraminic acid mutarotase
MLAFASAAAIAGGGFTATAPAHVARTGHTATALTSGLVFVVGGEPAGPQTAETYDPSSDNWTVVAAPPYRFRMHTATLLAGNRVLVVGGADELYGSSAHAAIYDAPADAWTTLPDLTGHRIGHTATLLDDGRVVIIGLDNNFQPETPSVEILNPQSMSWALAPPLAYPRSNHTATLLPSGRILVAGGNNPGVTPIASEIFDVAAYAWSNAPDLATPRKWHAAALLPSGKVLVAGGAPSASPFVALSSAEIFDPQSATWSPAGAMSEARYGHAALSLSGGDVAFLMGSGSVTNGVDLFSASSLVFSPPARSIFAHLLGAATALASGRLFAFGGYTNNGETYDPLAPSHRVTLTIGPYVDTPVIAGFHDVPSGGALTIPLNPVPEHSLAAGGTCGGMAIAGGYASAPIVADCSIDLQYPFIPHTITVNAGANGSIVPSPSVTVTNADRPLFVVTPDPHHTTVIESDCDHVSQYSGTLGPAYITVSDVTHDCTFSAMFPLVQLHVSTMLGSGGTIAPESVTADFGSAPTFTVTPDPGYVVTSIYGSCGNLPASLRSPDPVVYTPAALVIDCSVQASFARAYKVNAQTGAGATVTPSGTVLALDGEFVGFTLARQPGYLLDGISGNCGGSFYGNSATTSAVHGDCTLVFDVEYNTLWRPAGTAGAREEHTTTLLASGKVLLAGGFPYDPPARLYDPVTNAWTYTGALGTPRTLHSAIRLLSGKVLIIGGAASTGQHASLTSVELYDPDTGTFGAAGSLSVGRGAATATLLPSGKVLVTGGVHDLTASKSVELYDPATDQWSERAAMNEGRAYHAAALLPSGEVLVAGGGYGGASATSEIYDPASNTWRAGPTMAAAHESFNLAVLSSGRVLAVSGIRDFNQMPCDPSAELFDPATESWQPAGHLAVPRRGHVTIALPGGGAIVVGGSDCTSRRVSLVEMYFPAKNAWIPIGRLSDERVAHTATVLADGRVLVAGGYSDSDFPTLAEIMDPSTLVARCSLDVDQDGREDGLTDGLLIQRYIAGLRGPALTAGAVSADAVQPSAESIAQALAGQDLDIDGDGTVDPATDGTLVLRYLLRYGGTALTDPALGPGAIRKKPERIAGRLASGCIAY